MVARFGSTAELFLRELLAKRHFAPRRLPLSTLKRNDESLAADALRELVAKGLRNKGSTLIVLERLEEAAVAFDALLVRFDWRDRAVPAAIRR